MQWDIILKMLKEKTNKQELYMQQTVLQKSGRI